MISKHLFCRCLTPPMKSSKWYSPPSHTVFVILFYCTQVYVVGETAFDHTKAMLKFRLGLCSNHDHGFNSKQRPM